MADMINLEVDHTATIQHLQNKINAQFPFPVNCDRICHKGIPLNDKSQTLEQKIELPGPEAPFKVRGLREVCEFGGHQFWRFRGTSQWQPYKPDSPAPVSTQDNKYHLSIVLHQQASSRNHWGLFLAKEGEKGDILEVKGDAGYMRYAPSTEPVNPITLEGSCGEMLHFASMRRDGVKILQYLISKDTRIMDRVNSLLDEGYPEFVLNYRFGLCTPVQYAARAGSLENVKLLIEHGGDPWRLDPYQRNALDYAVYHQHKPVEEYLSDLRTRIT